MMRAIGKKARSCVSLREEPEPGQAHHTLTILADLAGGGPGRRARTVIDYFCFLRRNDLEHHKTDALGIHGNAFARRHLYLYVAAVAVVGIMAGIGSGIKSQAERGGGDHFADRADQMTVRRELPARVQLFEPDDRAVNVGDRFRQFDPVILSLSELNGVILSELFGVSCSAWMSSPDYRKCRGSDGAAYDPRWSFLEGRLVGKFTCRHAEVAENTV